MRSGGSTSGRKHRASDWVEVHRAIELGKLTIRTKENDQHAQVIRMIRSSPPRRQMFLPPPYGTSDFS